MNDLNIRIKTIRSWMICLFLLTVMVPKVNAWTDQTHMGIAKVGGLASYHNACAPDVSHTVAYMNKIWLTYSPAHYFDAKEPPTRLDVTSQLNYDRFFQEKGS